MSYEIGLDELFGRVAQEVLHQKEAIFIFNVFKKP